MGRRCLPIHFRLGVRAEPSAKPSSNQRAVIRAGLPSQEIFRPHVSAADEETAPLPRKPPKAIKKASKLRCVARPHLGDACNTNLQRPSLDCSSRVSDLRYLKSVATG